MVKTVEKEFEAGLWKQIMVDYLLLSALNWFILHTSFVRTIQHLDVMLISSEGNQS